MLGGREGRDEIEDVQDEEGGDEEEFEACDGVFLFLCCLWFGSRGEQGGAEDQLDSATLDDDLAEVVQACALFT